MDDIPKLLSEAILPDYSVLLVKVNYADQEYIEGDLTPPDALYSVIQYLKDKKVDILFASCGLHLNGEHKRPHIHYHMIVKSYPSGEFRTNNSQNRKRWLAKEENKDFSLENVTISFPKKLDPVWQTLSYPYKEGFVFKKFSVGLDTSITNFLLEYGKNLYQVSLGKRAKNDAYEERKKNALLDILNFCQEHKDRFKTFREMMEFLEDEYLAKIPVEQKPTLSNYKENCYKVGSTLGIFRYCDKI